MIHGIWITWENQGRNKGISIALGWPLYMIIYNKQRIIRYVLSSFKTLFVILKERPQVVVAQNPSIVLSGFVLLLKNFFGYAVIIDAHNSGIFPMEGRSKLLLILSKLIQRIADLTLVTNDKIKSVVESNRGSAFILPDKIPVVSEYCDFPLSGNINIAYICTYSDDEPFNEVIKAAYELPGNIILYFTGNYEGKIEIDSVPKNIKLLGFIHESEYWSLLSSVDFIMDLTTREGCLVCGAYEGIALLKPLILSDTEALKSYFDKGCIYVAPKAFSIANGIKRAIIEHSDLASNIKFLKREIENEWDDNLNKFKEIINSLC